MGKAKAKSFDYSVAIDREGGIGIAGKDPISLPEGWTADHLLLVALVRCSIHSLGYHARLGGHEVRAAGSASGRVSRRESDGRYAFVEISCSIEAALSPPPADPAALIANAERDCFVGATLVVKPRYEWRIG